MLTAEQARCQSDLIRAEAAIQYILDRQRTVPGFKQNVAYLNPVIGTPAIQELRKRGFTVGTVGNFVSW